MKSIYIFLLLLLPSFTSFGQNKVLSLNGNGYVEIREKNNILNLDGDKTVELLIRPSSFEEFDKKTITVPRLGQIDQRILFKRIDPEGQNAFMITLNGTRGGSFVWSVYDEYTEYRAMMLRKEYAEKAWYLLTCTFDDKTKETKIYVNSRLEVKGKKSDGGWNKGIEDQLNLRFGVLNDDLRGHFLGEIDEIKIWNRVKSEQEIKGSIIDYSTLDTDGLVAYWSFDNGEVKDLTKNGNDGQLLGDAKIENVSIIVLKAENQRRQNIAQGVLLSLGILHLLLFLFNPKSKENLYHTIFLSILGIYVYLIGIVNLNGQLSIFLFITVSTFLSSIYIMFLYSAFSINPIPKQFKILCIWSFVFYLLLFFLKDYVKIAQFMFSRSVSLSLSRFSEYLFIALPFLSLQVEILRVCISSALAGNKDSWIIGLGYVVLTISTNLANLQVILFDLPADLRYFAIGMLSFMVSTSIYLALNISRTNKGLGISNKALSEANNELENAKSHLEQINKKLTQSEIEAREELRDAHDMQVGLLPKSAPIVSEIQISGKSVPAREVGGDFYEYIKDNQNQLYIAVGDVSGKGLKGAMNAVMSSGILNLSARHQTNPMDIMSDINNSLCQSMEPDMNVTMVLAQFDLQQQRMTLVNAGQHAYPLLKRGKSIESIEARGLALGMISSIPYKPLITDVQSGDLLLFMTDGITEPRNTEGVMYEESGRLNEVLSSIPADMPIEGVVDTIINDVEAYTADEEQDDDITLVAVRVS